VCHRGLEARKSPYKILSNMARKRNNKQQNNNSGKMKRSNGLVTTRVNQSANLANRTVVRNGAPRVTSSGGPSITVSHTELATFVVANTTDTYTAGNTTPGGTLFPWLSTIAKGYSQYRWKRLRLLYSGLCGTNTAAPVILGAFYDGIDAKNWLTTHSFGDLVSTYGGVAGPAWAGTLTRDSKGRTSSEIMLEFDVDRIHRRTPWLTVGNLGPPSGSLAYDVINCGAWYGLSIGSLPSITSIGMLYWDYEVEFTLPTIPTANPALNYAAQKEDGDSSTAPPGPPVPARPPSWPVSPPVPTPPGGAPGGGES